MGYGDIQMKRPPIKHKVKKSDGRLPMTPLMRKIEKQEQARSERNIKKDYSDGRHSL